MHSPPIDLSVVIPAYCSAKSLPELLQRLTAVLQAQKVTFEIIIVDDASPDQTWSVLQSLYPRYADSLRLVRLARNTGQHNALMCGIRHALGNIIVTIDDDLQCQPEEIPKLLQELERGEYDLVYGNYRIKRHNVFRAIASIPVGLFVRYVFRLPVSPTSFRAFRRELAASVNYYRGSFTVIDGLLAWNTRRIGGVLIDHSPRVHGRSTHDLPRLVLLAFNIFTNFSILPLRLASLAGALACVGSVLVALKFALEPSGPDPFGRMLGLLFAGMLCLHGLQFLAIGLLGEYMGRIQVNINGKPQYVISQRVGFSDAAGPTPGECLIDAVRPRDEAC